MEGVRNNALTICLMEKFKVFHWMLHDLLLHDREILGSQITIELRLIDVIRRVTDVRSKEFGEISTPTKKSFEKFRK